MSVDTIFALASGAGRAGVAVVRISGSCAISGLLGLVKLPDPGQYKLSRIYSKSGEFLDSALVLCFPQGASFTGEETVELHLHGSPAVVSRVLQELGSISGFRPADAGEFTRRAFENDKLDLTQVEALADLIDADTEQQRLQAMRVFSGGLKDITESLRFSLIRAAALIEATIDFADEEVPEDVRPEVQSLLEDALGQLSQLLSRSSGAREIRNGFNIAIIGKPNVGKSTLLNAITGRSVAITSEIPGTTRDAIEARLDLNGFPITFIDTAGIRDTEDQIEKSGVLLSRNHAESSDIAIYLIDDMADLADFTVRENDVVRFAKGDLRDNLEQAVSGKSGAGLEALFNELTEKMQNFACPDVVLIRQRQIHAIDVAIGELSQAHTLLDHLLDLPELPIAHIYAAVHQLSGVIGDVDIENVLDEIFSSFCLGK